MKETMTFAVATQTKGEAVFTIYADGTARCAYVNTEPTKEVANLIEMGYGLN